MARPIKVITAGAEIWAELQRRANAPTSAHRDRFRAKIILLRLEGLKIATVAKRLKTSMPTVSTWSARFEAHGLDGLNDKSGRGRKPSITEKKIERVVTDATRPPKNRKRWSVRSMGRHAGVSHSTVQRIWSKNGLKPHVVKKFKLSNDPEFEKKFWDVTQGQGRGAIADLTFDVIHRELGVLCLQRLPRGAPVVRPTVKPVGKPDAGNLHVRLCVQRRLACSAGDKPAGVKVRAP